MPQSDFTLNRLAIVIVSWNTRDLTLACLRSVYDDFVASSLPGEVWLVDNLSSDGTPDAIREQFPQVNLLIPSENLGFAGGNNHALRAIGFPDTQDLPELVLLLNPDTLIQPGVLKTLIEGLLKSGAGLAGARLVYDDGGFQHSAFAFPGLGQLIIDLFPVPGRLHESKINGRYPRSLYEGDQPFPIDHPLGATFLLCREVILKTGMFDEEFFLYCEEIDWAIRIHEAGFKVVCVPTAEIVHFAGQSTSQVKPQSLLNLWTARIRLYHKHYPTLKRILALQILRMGMNRLIMKTARDVSYADTDAKAVVDACREIIRLSRKRL